MKIRAMMAMAALMAAGAQAQERDAMREVLNNPDVINAMRTAWQEARNGAWDIGATFRLDGRPSDYQVIAAPVTWEFKQQRVEIVSGKTFAIFHVHPIKGGPKPSPLDKIIADTYKLRIYTMHTHGPFEYDLVTKRTTELRRGLSWLTPLENRENREIARNSSR